MPENTLLVAILAAGASRRLGVAKQLVAIDGIPLARRQCLVALAASIGPVAIIVGSRAADLTPVVADLPVDVCVNPHWQEGMAASLRRAVRAALRHRAAALLVLACDQYRITPDDLRRLCTAWLGSGKGACVSRAGRHLGPPAIIPADRFDSVLELRGDVGARAVLFDSRRSRPLEVHNPRARFDVDYPHDVTRAQHV
jgi:molybdenum cofactor cytidylyltransferase